MAFTSEQFERYSRNIILEEVGVKGQSKLAEGRVLIVGAGGLGAPAAMYLAAAGVGTIGLVDMDEVELSNLQRQIIHSTGDIGKPKVLSGMETIREMNPDVQVATYQERANSKNIADIIRDRDYDFILDATDNFPAKFLINDACVMLGKPFSHAGILRFQGQLMTYLPGKGPCYRCVFREAPPLATRPSCNQAGVLGVICGVIGTLQATEALKFILGLGSLLNGWLLTYSALDMDFRKIKISPDGGCPVCGEEPVITVLADCD
ncbi:MAG: molybdopterin-synthase adenylyltransferase MoeB [Clostridiales Family XIII bacterium]|jgi:molybdopterin/thiamine biosynthesis adenylyltransferase|nr:molybdopterin-synthase adenylyltransferase MoeB [Clostridiales Family XIII bacterium]